MTKVTVGHFEYLSSVSHDGSQPNAKEYAETLKQMCNWLGTKSVLVLGSDDFPLGLLSGRRLARMHFDKDWCVITQTATGIIHRFNIAERSQDGKTFRYLKYMGDSQDALRNYAHFTPVEDLGIERIC